jgi:hypothetical protein
MSKQLCWLPKFGLNGQLVLHLRMERHQPWEPYTAYPQLSVPDLRIPGGSKGWATSQKLLRAGWTLISTEQARRSSVDNSHDNSQAA